MTRAFPVKRFVRLAATADLVPKATARALWAQEEDGRVVQYFERAVFEWWPRSMENDPPYRVLLRRLDAEALARRG